MSALSSLPKLTINLNNIKQSNSVQTLKSTDSFFQLTTSAVNAAEKLFYESNNKSLRTPVSLLQEICTKSLNPLPSYEFLATEGKLHQPIFVCRCYLNENYQAIAKGNSKKKAKHNAALSVLNSMKEQNLGVNNSLAEKLNSLIQSINDLDMEENPTAILNENNLEIKTENESLNTSEEVGNVEQIKESLNSCENPVGELIEIAQRFSMRPPEFEEGLEDGPPHNRQFTCFVTFGEYKETGTGRAKKLAKRNAAIKLLFKLKTSGNFNKPPNGTKQDSNANDHLNSKTSFSKKIVNIYNQFKASKNSAINYILNNDIESISKDLNKTFLDRLSIEENFKYVIYRIPNNSNGANKIVIIDFKVNPPMTYGGSGATEEEAINNAAYFSLNHIKIMCSKANCSVVN